MQVLETSLMDQVGSKGNHRGAPPGSRSLRMRLLVDAPRCFAALCDWACCLQHNAIEALIPSLSLARRREFEKQMKKTSLRGEVVEEVQLILNQVWFALVKRWACITGCLTTPLLVPRPLWNRAGPLTATFLSTRSVSRSSRDTHSPAYRLPSTA